MKQPSILISVFNRTITVDGEAMSFDKFTSSSDFAETIIEKFEYMWTADKVNEIKRDLIQLYYAIMEV